MPNALAELTREPVVIARCDEPEGVRIRRVWFMPLTLANLKKFWELSSQYPVLFGNEIQGNFKRFLEIFLRQGPDGITTNGLFWVVDNFVGVFYLTYLSPMEDATVHYTFLDGRHRGRLELTKAMLRYAFDRYKLRRMSVEIPAYVTKYTFNFVKELGFVPEGCRRKAALFSGKWFDLWEFGLLREELFDGRNKD